MRSRRDQLQAYQFLRHRIVSALLSGEPESVESPMRRIVRTSFAGLMVAVIALAVFGIIGLIKQGGANSWRAQDTIVEEKGSAALYVWHKGKLYPMLNYTSARLFLGSDAKASVSRKSLAGIPRQPTLGIQGAPGSPPGAGDLVRDPWTVCARTVNGQPKVTLLVGTRPLPDPLGPDAGVVVFSGSGEEYLIWKGRALKVTSTPVLAALGFSSDSVQPVGAAFVKALEHGPDITFPRVPGRGGQGPSLGGASTQIGQVFLVKGVGADEYFVMLAEGLAPISEGIAKLLVGNPDNHLSGPQAVGADVAAGARKAPRFDVAGYPDRSLKPPGGRGDRPVLCASISGTTTGRPARTVHALAELPASTQQEVLPGETGETPAADFVYVEPGHGALARDGNNRTPFLVVDGRKYPLGDGAREALGYDRARVSVLPDFFLSLLPTGPPLSSDAAGRPATPGAGASPAP